MNSYDLWFGSNADDLRAHPLRTKDPRRPQAPVEVAGWCGGNGPNIPSHQWPRSRRTGLPLMHLLTLRLPEEYRRRGPELEGVALFGSGEYLADADVSSIAAAFDSGSAEGIEGEAFAAGLQQYLDDPHPHEEIREDILEATYALVWLTADELAGRGVPPEKHLPTTLQQVAESVESWTLGASAWLTQEPETTPWLGLREDPNTGHAPNEDDEDGYVDGFELDEMEDRAGMSHLGGTALPVQGMPEGLTPWFLELETEVGGANFGDGNAQIDLESDTFDWACS